VLKLHKLRETEPLKNVKTEEITKNMELDKSPLFRRIITPWYDSDTACWILILWSLALFVFALTGLEIAISTPHFNSYVWFPLALTGLIFTLMVSLMFRMIRRNIKG